MIKKTSVTDWAFMITTGHPPFNTTTELRVYCNNSPDDTLRPCLQAGRVTLVLGLP